MLSDYCQQIEAVAMDSNTAFDLEVQEHCPNAMVIYDLFHLVAKYVIYRIREDFTYKLKHDKLTRRRLKGFTKKIEAT
ncbi:hypothetical protein BIT28_06875 [Photobacterium proteolyticum]|uniref:Transposase IS204/IS1001/IS1096/IS1165 DDE domain-containing protein n=1 Tax=Photobacterium proteolyticum TaxID=1903952 RepID=A0A1Q9GES8_9GAMM|nr:transposase [Photobacterium proteolyticum]OLQ72900.1 hypothetical protein BIT28_06875 [Photobacterium proteolyticum]